MQEHLAIEAYKIDLDYGDPQYHQYEIDFHRIELGSAMSASATKLDRYEDASLPDRRQQ